MANSKNNNPVLFDLYEQEIHITEPRMVYDGCIDMAGLPDSYIGVTVTDENNNRLVEITDGKAPSEGEFKVDYKHGWLYVDPKAYYKQKLTLDFYSRGIELTPASRIYTIDQNGCVDINKTLQTYIDEVNGHCKFDIADKFENLESGDSFNVMFGKLAKWYEIYNSEIEKIISNTTLIKNEDSGFAAGDMAGTGGGSATGNRASSSDGGAAGSGATTGNGGAVGSEAKSKYGFAGGYGAESTNGSATGEEAKSNDGGAAGYGATTEDGGSVGSHAVSQNGGAVGSEATTMNGGAVGSNAKSGYGFAGGSNAQTGDGGAAGEEAKSSCGFAGGAVAETYDGGAVGSSAKSGNGFSGGAEAQVGKDENDVYIDAIQLGAGTNSNEKTLQVYNYQVTAFDGVTDTYWLNDVGKLSGLNTTNKDTIVEGINSIVNNTTLIKNSNGGFAAGQDAVSEYDGAAIGSEAHTYDGGAVGEHANSSSGGAIGSDSNTNSGGSIGYNTKSTGGGAIGEEARAGDGFSGGNSAQVGKDTNGVYIDAIQLGSGTNSNERTLQVYDYQVTAFDDENNVKYLKDVGKLSDLNTTDKSSIVSAVTEVNNKAKNLEDTKADKVTDDGFVAGGARKHDTSAVTIGSNAKTDVFGVAIGHIASASVSDVAIGDGAEASGEEGVALGKIARATERKSIQLGSGTNSNERTLQVYDYQVTAFDGATDTYWLNDVGKLSRLNTVDKSDIVSSINELNGKAISSFNAVMSSPISITEPFSINSSGDWTVGYTIPPITVNNEVFGTFILPTAYLEPAHGYNYGSKYCYAQYKFNVDNPSGTLSETEISVDILYKNVKGNTNSYIEIEDGNIIASINIYLGEIRLSRQMNINNEYDYFGSASVNTESKLSLLCVTQISTLSTRLSNLEKRIALLEQKLATAVSTDALIQGDDTIIFDNGDSVI